MTNDHYKVIIEILLSPYILFTSYQKYVEITDEELLIALCILQLFRLVGLNDDNIIM